MDDERFENKLRVLLPYISKAAQHRKITQKEIAKSVGISSGSVAKILKGELQPDKLTLIRLCRAVGIDADSYFSCDTKDDPISGPLSVYIDSEAYTPEERGELLSLISELYWLQSGDRLVIDSKGTAEPACVEVIGPKGGN